MREALRHRLHKLQDSTSIAQQLGVVLSVVCILGLIVVSIFSARLSGWAIAERIQQNMSLTAATIADRLDVDMFERYREVRNLAQLRALDIAWEGDAALLRAALNQAQSGMRHFAWIGFARPDGQVVAATQGMLEGTSVFSRPWFRDGLKGPTVGDLHEAVLLAKLLPNLGATGDPERFVDIAFPVHSRDGRLLGVLGAHLYFRWVEGLRDTVLKAQPGVNIVVMSSEGIVLLGPERGDTPFTKDRIARMSVTRTGAFVQKSPAGDLLTGYAISDGEQDFPGFGWIVVAQQPAEDAFASAYHVAFRIIGYGAIALLVCVGLTLWFARRLGRPLRQLALAAEEIGRDPKITMLPRLRGNADVMHLSYALRSLLRRLTSAETRYEMFSRKHEQDVAALKELADTDPLTGLLNRRSFLAMADVALDSAHATGQLGILMADIDHFKQVNDTYGHAAGDAVLKHVADTFVRTLRAHDHLARFGGEEFVALLQDTDAVGMRALADRVREAVAATKVVFEDQAIAVTISIGAALAHDQDRDMHKVIERADLALYEAKNSGRNRIVISPEPSLQG